MKHQDYIYLKEDYYSNPKESFKFLANLIYNDFKKPSILDIGCSKGEFLNYVKNNFDYEILYGIDYSENLINIAKQHANLKDNNIFFQVADAENFQIDSKFDAIVMSGVLSYFDNPSFCIKQIANHIKHNGYIYIYGFFNDYDVDVLVQYRNNKFFNSFEKGWNYHSVETLSKIFAKNDIKVIDIKNFDVDFDIIPQDDPRRGWHIKTQNGRKYTNGLGLLYEPRIIIAKKD